MQMAVSAQGPACSASEVLLLPAGLQSGTVGFDDLCVRFLLNQPQEKLRSVERICFQIEKGRWF